MRIKSVFTALTAGVAIIGTTLFAAPAQADCTSHVYLPATVVINRAFQTVNPGLGTCSTAKYVSADLVGPDGVDAVFTYDPPYYGAHPQYPWDVYDSQVVLGNYYTRNSYSYDNNYDPIAVTPAYMTVRFGSVSQGSATRSGSLVTIGVYTGRWNAAYDQHRFTGWSAQASIQYWTGSTWQSIKVIQMPVSGRASWSYATTAYRTYRVHYLGTSYT